MGELETQIMRHCAGMRFVEPAKSLEPLANVDVTAQGNTSAAQQVAQTGKLFIVEAREFRSAKFLLGSLAMEDVPDVNQNMPPYGECELGLALHRAFDGGDDQSACVKNRC